MKALNISFIVFGILILGTGFFETIMGMGGEFLTFNIASPWFGTIKIFVGVAMLLSAYDYFKKKKDKPN